MILHEMPTSASPHAEQRGFVADALRCRADYRHFWRQSAITSLGKPPREGVFVVDDTQQEIGAFKIRGAAVAVNEAMRLSPSPLSRVCAASSGSFGMGIASAANQLGLEAAIFTPSNAAARKKTRIRSFGAVVDDSEATYEAAKQKARNFSSDTPTTAFLDGVGWEVFKGNATLAAEMAESGLLTRGKAAVIVPLGIGSLAVPMHLFLRESGFETDLFLVEPLSHCKFLADHVAGLRPTFADTLADGAGVRAVPDLTRPMLHRIGRAIIALSEEEIVEGMRYLWRRAHIQAEGAGALAAGALLACAGRFAEYDQVWLIVTGRNIESSVFESLVGPDAKENSHALG